MIGWFEKKRAFSVIFFILIVAEIFFFSSISGGPPSPGPSIDVSIIYHFSVFFLLNFFLLTSLNKNGKIKIKYLIIASLFSIIYSVLDELHQLFVPLRHAGLGDIFTNNVGIFLSNITYLYYKNKNLEI